MGSEISKIDEAMHDAEVSEEAARAEDEKKHREELVKASQALEDMKANYRSKYGPPESGKPEDFFDKDGKFVPKLLGDRIRLAHAFKTIRKAGIYVYQDGVYHNSGEALVENLAKRLLGDRCSAHRINEAIVDVSVGTYISKDDINADPNLINLSNGIYDIAAGKLVPHSPDLFMVTQLPAAYEPDAQCPKILEFLDQVLDKRDIPAIQETIGYCLWKAYPIHKATMFIGEGSNGKSTLLNVIREFLGHDNVSNVALQDLDRNRFSAAALYGKLANIYTDVPANAMYQTGKFKMLTGGDSLMAEQKFRDGFSFVNYAKLLFSTNKLPETTDDTDAYMRRWKFHAFPNKFEGDNQDIRLLEKLTTPEELSGLFNWALEGMRRLLEAGSFSGSKTTDDIRDQYERLSSPIHAFIKDMVELDNEAETPKDVIYGAYAQYCQDNGLPPLDKAVFARKLPAAAPNVAVNRPKIDGLRIQCWKGIKITPDIPGSNAKNHKNRDNDKQGQLIAAGPLTDPAVSRLKDSRVRDVRENPLSYCNTETKKNKIIGICTDTHDPKGHVTSSVSIPQKSRVRDVRDRSQPVRDVRGKSESSFRSGMSGQIETFIKKWSEEARNSVRPGGEILAEVGEAGMEELMKFGRIYETSPGRFKLV